MGSLFYGDMTDPIEIDDDTLAHLKAVVFTKLRRQESFTLSWLHASDDPLHRSLVWLAPAIPLRFVFDEVEAPGLDREWIQLLAASASTAAGIRLVPNDRTGALTMPGEGHTASPHQVGESGRDQAASRPRILAGGAAVSRAVGAPLGAALSPGRVPTG